MANLKKHWVPVLAPSLFKREQLGESYVLETDTLKGRGIKINLMNLTSDMKRQNLNVAFRITDVKEGKANTRVTGVEMQPTSVKRLVRRGRTKIDDSFLVNLAHGQVARIKPLLITKNITSNTSATALRHRAREVIKEITSTLSFETLVQDVVQLKFQRHLKRELSRVVPLRSIDVRILELQPRFAMDEEREAEPSSYAGNEAVVEDATERS